MYRHMTTPITYTPPHIGFSNTPLKLLCVSVTVVIFVVHVQVTSLLQFSELQCYHVCFCSFVTVWISNRDSMIVYYQDDDC